MTKKRKENEDERQIRIRQENIRIRERWKLKFETIITKTDKIIEKHEENPRLTLQRAIKLHNELTADYKSSFGQKNQCRTAKYYVDAMRNSLARKTGKLTHVNAIRFIIDVNHEMIYMRDETDDKI